MHLILLFACVTGTTAPLPNSAAEAKGFPFAAGDVAINRVTIVDADGARADQVVVLRGDAIAAVVPPQRIPAGVTIVDGRGRFLVPGLVDAHVHLAHGGGTVWTGSPLAANLRASLYHGVTAVYDLGGPDVILSVRDAIDAGAMIGPTIHATGPFLTAEGSHPCETSLDPDLCVFVTADTSAAAADDRVAAGADGIKIALADAAFSAWPTPRLDPTAIPAIVAAGLPVIAHIDTDTDVLDAITAGVSVLAHPPFGGPASTEGLAAAAMADGVDTTVAAFSGVVELLDGTTNLANPGLILGPGVLSNWTVVRAHPEVLEPGWADASALWAADARANLALLDAAGATLLPGSDAGYYFVPHGVGLHNELRGLVDMGWTPQEALTAATLTSREVLGFAGGRVAAGAPADLLLLNADPLLDIANLDNIQKLILKGSVYNRSTLRAMDLATPAAAVCLDNGDCGVGEACDGFDHVCAATCPTPSALINDCGTDAWCMAEDGYAATTGVCHPESPCDLYAQDCGPASYTMACIPYDADTNACWYGGPRTAGQRCGWNDPAEACQPGLYCSTIDARCYTLCDPDGPDTCAAPATCQRQYADAGTPWFGLCLR